MAEFDEKLNLLLSNPDAMAQIMQMAQSLGNSQPTATEKSSADTKSSEPVFAANTQTAAFSNQPSASADSGSANLFSSLSGLAGNLDPKLLMKFLPLIQELGGQQNSNARQLLYALRPYLKAERQDKIERALQLARLFHLGKKFLSEWEG